uniref:Uncharacterized protein n=1 Tax=Arabidopsis thaliana TaxID=3702 RepID=Q0WPX5_ARATH|nr:hypothetical protein [Arabidopsis thaliana]
MTHLRTPCPHLGAVFNRSLDNISLILAVIASEAAKTHFSPSKSCFLTDTIPGAIQLPKYVCGIGCVYLRRFLQSTLIIK